MIEIRAPGCLFQTHDRVIETAMGPLGVLPWLSCWTAAFDFLSHAGINGPTLSLVERRLYEECGENGWV